MPFCVTSYRLMDADGNVLAACTDNHQTRNVIDLEPPVRTDRLHLELIETHGDTPAALFEIRCYAPPPA